MKRAVQVLGHLRLGQTLGVIRPLVLHHPVGVEEPLAAAGLVTLLRPPRVLPLPCSLDELRRRLIIRSFRQEDSRLVVLRLWSRGGAPLNLRIIFWSSRGSIVVYLGWALD